MKPFDIVYQKGRLPERVRIESQGGGASPIENLQAGQTRDELINAIIEKSPVILRALAYGDDQLVHEIVTLFSQLGSSEADVRNLLIHLGRTFDLFKSRTGVLIKESKSQKQVSIDIYLKDLADPRFQGQIDYMIEQGCIPKNSNLELRAERHGIFGWNVISNIYYLRMRGFSISVVSDMDINQNNTVDSESLWEILRAGFKPIFVKIPRRIIAILRTKNRSDGIELSERIGEIIGIIHSNKIPIVPVES